MSKIKVHTIDIYQDSATGDKYQINPAGTYTQISTAGAANVTDAISIQGNTQASFATSNIGAQSAALTGGIYDVWASVDTYIKVGTTANDVTTSTGYLLRGGNTIAVVVPDQSKIGAILSSGTSTLYYQKVT